MLVCLFVTGLRLLLNNGVKDDSITQWDSRHLNRTSPFRLIDNFSVRHMMHMCIPSKVIPSVYQSNRSHLLSKPENSDAPVCQVQSSIHSAGQPSRYQTRANHIHIQCNTGNWMRPKTEAVTTCTLLQMSTMTWKKKLALLNEENLDVLRQKFLLLPPSSTAYCPEKYWYKTCHQLCVEACYSVGSLTWHGDHMRRTDTMYSFLCTDNIVYYSQVNE